MFVYGFYHNLRSDIARSTPFSIFPQNPITFRSPNMFCPPLPGMRMRGCTDIMGKWYTLRCADSRYQGRNALRLDFRVSRGYEGVPKSRENGTPWQGRVHSPVSEQPISNRKAISVQLRYCLWGKVPQIRDKAVLSRFRNCQCRLDRPY